jgi:20S proteasome subunit alpha 6
VSITLTGAFCDDINYGIGTLEELVQHGLHALRETLQQDKELNTLNTSIGIIGPRSTHETDSSKDTGAFRILEGEKVDPFLKTMIPKESTTAAPDTSAPPAAASGEDVQMSD